MSVLDGGLCETGLWTIFTRSIRMTDGHYQGMDRCNCSRASYALAVAHCLMWNCLVVDEVNIGEVTYNTVAS